ncbi:MAG: ATP-dependent DNA helicase [Brachymonas sp.]
MSFAPTASPLAAPQATSKPLHAAVAAAFATDGALAQGQTGYRPRQAQLHMANAIAEAISNSSLLVVEAGTGTGKTYAYLVPALLSGQRVLVSTASKALQEQLYKRDLPTVMRALGIHSRTALLKGRANYLCIYRMQQARQQPLAANLLANLAQVERWSQHTESGDLAEVATLAEDSPLRPFISSSRENCLGNQCPSYDSCHLLRARNQAMQSELVVVNHHLLFADMAIKEEGFGQLLPHTDIVILDEAHQLNEIGVQFLGQRLSSTQLLDFCRDVLATGLAKAGGLVDWQGLVQTLEYATREQRLTIGSSWNKGQSGIRLRWQGSTPEGLDQALWQRGWDDIGTALEGLRAGLDSVSEMAPDIQRLYDRACDLQSALRHFAQPHQGEGVRWLEAGSHWIAAQAPLDIASALRKHIYPDTGENLDANSGVQAEKPAWVAPKNEAQNPALPCLAPLGAPLGVPLSTPAASAPISTTENTPAPEPRSWIFTSATLGDANGLGWFTAPCGLHDAPSLRLASPFDYAGQAALYIPADMPPPAQTAAHSSAVATLAARAAQVLGGKTLVLTTTNRALKQIASELRAQLGSEINVLEQGQGSKEELIAALRSGTPVQRPSSKTAPTHAAESAQTGCVLVATASLWEGIDIPGDALQLVIIDKLPFPPPGDPVIEARSQRLEAQGLSPFSHHALPEAAVALKQGAGRLIRSESDRGALVICDVRLAQTGYGKRLQASLPPMKKLGTEAELLGFLAALQQPAVQA